MIYIHVERGQIYGTVTVGYFCILTPPTKNLRQHKTHLLCLIHFIIDFIMKDKLGSIFTLVDVCFLLIFSFYCITHSTTWYRVLSPRGCTPKHGPRTLIIAVMMSNHWVMDLILHIYELYDTELTLNINTTVKHTELSRGVRAGCEARNH